MKYFSTFSGIGGFELGIQNAYEKIYLQKLRSTDERQSTGLSIGDKERPCEQLPKLSTEGLSCVGYSELDKYAIETYQKNFNHKNYGDITKIDEKTLPDFDLLVGGFPCQAFSIAGKRAGFDDTRGTLFFDLARIVREKQPRNFIFENVKGLLSHDKGSTFRTIITTLDELGYDIEWQVLNSKNFGVPQNRERVYIVGHLRGESRPKVFPILRATSQTLKQTIGGAQGSGVYNPDGLSVTLASQSGGHGGKTGLYLTKNPNEKINRTVRASGRSSLSEKHNWDTHLVDGAIRRLTPIECERLQGFPDNWTKKGLSDSQRYKQCGNAVTTNVVEEIISRLI